MKKTTQKILCCLLAFLLLAGTMLTGCKSEPLVIKDSETCIVIRTTKEVVGDKTDMVLIDYMSTLIADGKLTCKIEDGMVTSINGINNPADFSSCWMLYTSDAENSNSAWGTVEYDGKEYGSAVSGAETLKIKANEIYIWVFKSFS
jgi:hypothetical protein